MFPDAANIFCHALPFLARQFLSANRILLAVTKSLEFSWEELPFLSLLAVRLGPGVCSSRPRPRINERKEDDLHEEMIVKGQTVRVDVLNSIHHIRIKNSYPYINREDIE